MTPPDETWHCCETTFDSLTSVLSAAGSWSRENAARENPLIWTAPRPGARHRLGFGSELQPGKGLDSLRWLGLQWEDKAASTGWERIHPAASNSLKDLKTERWMGSSFMASSSSSWSAGPSSTADTWSMSLPVWRWCSERWRQQEGDRRAFGSADGSGRKKKLLFQSTSLLAFTKGGNTFSLPAVIECSLMSAVFT